MTEKRPLKVFLCHAHADRDSVRGLYARLKREGVDVWLDKEKLLPGADWEYEIRKAVREADVVVVCLSKQFNQAGFRQKEVRIALDAAMEKPEGEIFIIPARLEECDNLESLSRWHWVDLFESDGFQRLMLALRVRAEKIGAALRQRGHTISRPKINAAPEAEELARQKAEREKAEQESAHKARLQAEELARQKAAREKAERDAIEKARLESEELARRKTAHEKAEKAEREAAEKARLKTEELAKLKAAREKAEKDAAAKARLQAEELAGQNAAREKVKPKPETQKPRGKSAVFWVVGIFAVVLVIWLSSLDGTPSTPEPTKTKTPTLAPTVASLPDEIVDDKGVTMRLVPAGTFTMGSEIYDDEKPIHEVYLDAFYMDKYEVTNAAYKRCVDAGECDPPKQSNSYTREAYYGNSVFDEYPVIYVDWNMAKTYCEWRGASLPTEAQWEKAARGTGGRTYPWGEGIDCDKANYSGCKGDTAPVGSYESGKSPYGLYDMAGNVWEWVSSLYQPYPYDTADGREDLSVSGNRVLRGGSWFGSDNSVRSAYHDGNYPASTYSYGGFRCARSQ